MSEKALEGMKMFYFLLEQVFAKIKILQLNLIIYIEVCNSN